jgi:hypothetical protein
LLGRRGHTEGARRVSEGEQSANIIWPFDKGALKGADRFGKASGGRKLLAEGIRIHDGVVARPLLRGG